VIVLTVPPVVKVEVVTGEMDKVLMVALGLVVDEVLAVAVMTLGPVSIVMTVVTAETPDGNEAVAAFGRVIVTVLACGGELVFVPVIVVPPTTTVIPAVRIVVPPTTEVEPAGITLVPFVWTGRITATVAVTGLAGLRPGV